MTDKHDADMQANAAIAPATEKADRDAINEETRRVLSENMDRLRSAVTPGESGNSNSKFEEAVNTFVSILFTYDMVAQDAAFSVRRSMTGASPKDIPHRCKHHALRTKSLSALPLHLQIAYYERAASAILAHRDACVAKLKALNELVRQEVARTEALGLYPGGLPHPVVTEPTTDANMMREVSKVLLTLSGRVVDLRKKTAYDENEGVNLKVKPPKTDGFEEDEEFEEEEDR